MPGLVPRPRPSQWEDYTVLDHVEASIDYEMHSQGAGQDHSAMWHLQMAQTILMATPRAGAPAARLMMSMRKLASWVSDDDWDKGDED